MTAALATPSRPVPQVPVPGTAHLPDNREFDFSDRDFERVRQLIHQKAGISLHDGKRAMVYSRLARRLRETGHDSFTSYLQWLETGDGEEWQTFVNALTTNLTAFFREEHHFDILARELAQRRNLHSPQNPLRIWCNAASTGQEPYTIAITVTEAWGAQAPVRIVATDIDTHVLDVARKGVYAADGVRGLSPQRLKRFFLRGTGRNEGHMRVRPELQAMVEYRRFNLMQPGWSLGEPFDIVFCRNVMIYFDAQTQRDILAKTHAVMKPHGLLFVGHSENFSDARHLFALKGKTVYDRL